MVSWMRAGDKRPLGQRQRLDYSLHSKQQDLHVCVSSSCPAPAHGGDAEGTQVDTVHTAEKTPRCSNGLQANLFDLRTRERHSLYPPGRQTHPPQWKGTSVFQRCSLFKHPWKAVQNREPRGCSQKHQRSVQDGLPITLKKLCPERNSRSSSQNLLYPKLPRRKTSAPHSPQPPHSAASAALAHLLAPPPLPPPRPRPPSSPTPRCMREPPDW